MNGDILTLKRLNNGVAIIEESLQEKDQKETAANNEIFSQLSTRIRVVNPKDINELRDFNN